MSRSCVRWLQYSNDLLHLLLHYQASTHLSCTWKNVSEHFHEYKFRKYLPGAWPYFLPDYDLIMLNENGRESQQWTAKHKILLKAFAVILCSRKWFPLAICITKATMPIFFLLSLRRGFLQSYSRSDIWQRAKEQIKNILVKAAPRCNKIKGWKADRREFRLKHFLLMFVMSFY